MRRPHLSFVATLLVAAAASPATADVAPWRQEAQILPADPAAEDLFGADVDIDGDVAVIGSPWDDDQGSLSGAAYVFRFDGTSWVQEQKLLAADGAMSRTFGLEVEISDGVILVGAPAFGDPNQGSAAYIFRFDGAQWVQEARLVPADGFAWQGFSSKVALSGQVAAIGAPGDDDKGAGAGAVYLYRYDGTGWPLEKKVVAADGRPDRGFGDPVALSGSTLMAGALNNRTFGTLSGAVYVIRHDGTQWLQTQKLVASDGHMSQLFGSAIAISGNTALFAAQGDSTLYTESGAAYVFGFDGTSWTHRQKLLPSDGGPAAGAQRFGRSVALDGERALIGSDFAAHAGLVTGATYAYRFVGTSWLEAQRIVASDGGQQDHFGGDVALSGERALISASHDDAPALDSGSTYAFRFVHEVAIDIRPWSDVDHIDPLSPHNVPVAILGSSLDVAEIDEASLAFGPSGAAPAFSIPLDVDADGSLDLVSFYRIADTGVAFGDLQACVTGETHAGTAFQGCGAIQTIPAPGCGGGFATALWIAPLACLRARRMRRAPRG